MVPALGMIGIKNTMPWKKTNRDVIVGFKPL
jgi:hypothetical protein